jgi:hypothetical protein
MEGAVTLGSVMNKNSWIKMKMIIVFTMEFTIIKLFRNGRTFNLYIQINHAKIR